VLFTAAQTKVLTFHKPITQRNDTEFITQEVTHKCNVSILWQGYTVVYTDGPIGVGALPLLTSTVRGTADPRLSQYYKPPTAAPASSTAVAIRSDDDDGGGGTNKSTAPLPSTSTTSPPTTTSTTINHDETSADTAATAAPPPPQGLGSHIPSGAPESFLDNDAINSTTPSSSPSPSPTPPDGNNNANTPPNDAAAAYNPEADPRIDGGFGMGIVDENIMLPPHAKERILLLTNFRVVTVKRGKLGRSVRQSYHLLDLEHVSAKYTRVLHLVSVFCFAQLRPDFNSLDAHVAFVFRRRLVLRQLLQPCLFSLFLFSFSRNHVADVCLCICVFLCAERTYVVPMICNIN
jgi:hypothetical protein